MSDATQTGLVEPIEDRCELPQWWVFIAGVSGTVWDVR